MTSVLTTEFRFGRSCRILRAAKADEFALPDVEQRAHGGRIELEAVSDELIVGTEAVKSQCQAVGPRKFGESLIHVHSPILQE